MTLVKGIKSVYYFSYFRAYEFFVGYFNYAVKQINNRLGHVLSEKGEIILQGI